MRAAVFDTNVIVSGFLSPHGPPGRIVEWLRSGVAPAVLDDRILDEYVAVLSRKSLGLPGEEVHLVLDAIRRHARWVTVKTTPTVDLPDPDDAPFLECAQSADVVLVTGNLRHYPKALSGGVRVVTPAEYVAAVGGSVHEPA